MEQFDNLSGGTTYVEFEFNGRKGKINIKAFHHFNKSLKLYHEKKYFEAAQEIDKCITAEPKNQNSYYVKGYIVETIPHVVSAIAAYKKSLQIDPSQH